ncbi:G protein-activated inward rectifier potassium channel 2-like isoform X2 [Pomacea canaliculata]|uniref:G protein-activated inward rectifier potassium channel 2-like isoform X2 n=1 Tax=Pomacea canaliculata TaxID=400727 RepID=UPI000D725F5F|nr:G protein-activated inward rectifier potassium channel 2-like isoform X2 [Pomacea canaliculata]
MANKDNPGYKVEELTPQNSAFTSRGQPRRSLLEKEGNSNLSFRGIERKPLMYLKDLYVTLVDLKWRYVLVILLTVYLLSYLVFAVFYWLLSYMNGQFGSRASEPGYEPCIKNLDSFAGAFLFSMETQSTIGFGHLNPNAACPGVVPVIYFQITVGFMVETFILGFLFVKVARPKHRRHTLVFSRSACLCLEDGDFCLQLRVGDLRRTHLVDATVHGLLVRRRVVSEQHVYPLFQHRMTFTAHGMEDKVFLIWPLILSHRITADSPCGLCVRRTCTGRRWTS